MLNADAIQKLFKALNEELTVMKVVGEIGICGGAVMCLVFKARAATKDIDAIFAPTQEIRIAARRVAKKFGLNADWLNDAAKGFFLTEPPRQNVLELSNLRVWAPGPEYLLAMKCAAARWDTHDREDVEFLLKHLELKTRDQAFGVIVKYCPKSRPASQSFGDGDKARGLGRIPAKTRFLIEELIPGR
ncbi:MAG: hypothetical protein HY747_01435 [Elusimicrobia bacterium]|nr:hypothetical protein [Elusimicrobiota bacterium]